MISVHSRASEEHGVNLTSMSMKVKLTRINYIIGELT